MANTPLLDPNGLYRVGPITRTKDGPPPLFDLSASTWWAGVKTGRFPKPVRRGKRMTCWRGYDLLGLVQSVSGGQT